LKVAATTGEELETWLDSLSHPSTATNGDQ